MKVTMNQEELIHAMNQRVVVLTQLKLVKMELEHFENVAQCHDSEKLAKLIPETIERVNYHFKEMKKAGVSLGNFAAAYMHIDEKR